MEEYCDIFLFKLLAFYERKDIEHYFEDGFVALSKSCHEESIVVGLEEGMKKIVCYHLSSHFINADYSEYKFDDECVYKFIS